MKVKEYILYYPSNFMPGHKGKRETTSLIRDKSVISAIGKIIVGIICISAYFYASPMRLVIAIIGGGVVLLVQGIMEFLITLL